MVRLAMIALWIGAFASGVVAVSNDNVPVRRQRLSSPDSADYEDALDEPDGDVVQSGALGESQGPGPGSCTPGRSGRNCRRSQCSRIGSSPKSGNFAAGACGVDACPSGYKPITAKGECATAAAALGFTWYAGGYERSTTNGRANVCNFCGGCGGRDGKRDGGRTVRIDDNHFNVANFICKKACNWGETTSENDGSSVCKPWSDYVNCAEEKRQGACTDGNEWVAKHCSSTCKATAVAKCGEYVIVDRFDGSFWGQRSAMGYAYYQRNAASMNELLTWSASNNVDWGWKEGSNYGQLFYKQGNGASTPAFAASLKAWTPDRVNCNAADACVGGGRCSFVKESVLLSHPSWRNTAARAALR